MKQKAYAIDYGTSNSVIICTDKDSISEPLKIDLDKALMKSLSYFLDDETYYHGKKAIIEYEKNSFEGRFIRSIKKFLPDDKFQKTRIGDRFYLIESLIGFFLKEMKDKADQLIGEKVTKVLLGRPAKYHIDEKLDHLAQERMYRAAKIAGFEEIDFFPEPLAAASYSLDEKDWKNLFVVDIGAGTSDYTWVQREDQDYKVLSLNSVNTAGDSFDGDVMNHAIGEEFATQVSYKLPMSSNFLEMPQDIKFRLRSPADICFLTKSNIYDFLNDIKKATLSESDLNKIKRLEILLEDNLAFDLYSKIEEAKIHLSQGKDYLFEYSYPGIEIKKELKATDFPEWTKNSLQKILGAMEGSIGMAKKDPKEIDLVLLTGGSSQIPLLREKIQNYFPKTKLLSPEDFFSVSMGLANKLQTSLRL